MSLLTIEKTVEPRYKQVMVEETCCTIVSKVELRPSMARMLLEVLEDADGAVQQTMCYQLFGNSRMAEAHELVEQLLVEEDTGVIL